MLKPDVPSGAVDRQPLGVRRQDEQRRVALEDDAGVVVVAPAHAGAGLVRDLRLGRQQVRQSVVQALPEQDVQPKLAQVRRTPRLAATASSVVPWRISSSSLPTSVGVVVLACSSV